MRKDMAKILVERPREGHSEGESSSRLNRRISKQILALEINEDEFSCPDKQGIKQHIRNHEKINKKRLNENLNPFRRYLLSQVGRKWDDVYSDIMKNLNLNNAVQFHVWQHLIEFGEVETKTYMEGKHVMASGILGPGRIVNSRYRAEFFVHPETGNLCVTKREKKYNYKEEKKKNFDKFRYIDSANPLTQYHIINGVWYEIKLIEATEEEKKHKSFGKMAKVHNFKLNAAYTPQLYEWKPLAYNRLVDQIIQNREIKENISFFDRYLWVTCNELFCGHYLPISKKQVDSKQVKKIKAMMSSNKTA